MKMQAPGFRIPPLRAAACKRRPEVFPRLPALILWLEQRRMGRAHSMLDARTAEQSALGRCAAVSCFIRETQSS